MSLVFCPECGHEVSISAVACPNCGLPLSAAVPAVEKVTKTVVPPPRPVVRERMPPWAIAALGLLGVGLLFALIFLFRSSSDDGNVNIAVNANRRADPTRTLDDLRSTTTSVPPSQTSPVTIPDSQTGSAPSTTTTVPSTSAPAPAYVPPPDKGTVVIKAKLTTARGAQQPARGVKFYLLDKDLETILSEARVEPIEGNSLSASLGLAAVFPDRYRDFQRSAMRAISQHVKYSGSTDPTGTANLGSSVKPDQYYLFSVTRSGDGFAMWNSPITVIAGENILDLGPQPITEIQETDGF